MKNINIRTKLIVSFVSLVLIAAVATGITIYSMRSMGENLSDLYNHPYKVSNAVRDIANGIVTIHHNVKDMVLALDDLERQNLVLKIDEIESDIYEKYDLIKKQYLGDKQDLIRLERGIKEWKYIRDEVILLVQEGNLKGASDIIRQEERDHINKLNRQVDELRMFTDEEARRFHEKAGENMHRAFLLVFLLLSSLIIISIVLGMLLTNNITGRLSSIMVATQKITKGKLDDPIEVYSKDEIGKLGLEFIKLQKGLQHKAEISDAIAVGNFERKVTPNSYADRLAISINEIISNFKAVVEHAENIANGKYSLNIKPKSDKDQLGKSLQLMANNLREVIEHTRKISNGNYNDELRLKKEDDELAMALNKMTESLRKTEQEASAQNYLQSALNNLNTSMQGDLTVQALADAIINVVAKSVHAQIGAFYVNVDEGEDYQLQGSYAFNFRKEINNVLLKGQGVAGQAIVEKQMISVSEVPEDYFRINSALGESLPKFVTAIPIVQENKVLGVIELGSFNDFDAMSCKFIEEAAKSIGSRLIIALNKNELRQAFLKTQELAQKLQAQQEELRQTNSELEEQTEELRASEAELQKQQEELRVVNEELEAKTSSLMTQKSEIERKNHILQEARKDLEQKAKELEMASKYKSEFLANMSHELRTPLNSLLILSQNLQENRPKNLTKEQLESLGIIYDSGKFLLNLINEILDLSKIEAHKMEVDLSPVAVNDLTLALQKLFSENIKEKKLNFNIQINPGVPELINTDISKINQILRNLLSNAIKFTKEGSVDLIIRRPGGNDEKLKSGLTPQNTVVFEVRDTGIGIPEGKLQEIFEAFKQVDGSITREFGGTGLGLSITREIVKLLGGDIKVQSTLGKGSVFMAYIPVDNKTDNKIDAGKEIENIIELQEAKTLQNTNKSRPVEIVPDALPHINDDRDNIGPDDRVILVVEDDLHYSKILYDECRDKNFMCIACPSGEEAKQIINKQVIHAIILDLGLPGMSGEDFLYLVKNNIKTRHIPIHIITAAESPEDIFSKGAISFKHKPVLKTELEELFQEINQFIVQGLKKLLVVEDNEVFQNNIVNLLGANDVSIDVARTGQDAIQKIEEGKNDCVILDIGLPDISGFEVLSILESKGKKIPPVIIYTGKELTREESELLNKHSKSVIVKGVKSEERLIDEVALFLHRVVKELPDRQRKLINKLYSKEEMFKGKTILIVDDDIRNVFALTKLFEENQMNVLRADNGAKGLEILTKETAPVDLVLMDIMMPVMNGFEAIKRIREQEKHKELPVIAVTAKAMRADKENCMKVGANDYVTKPIDIERLFSLMRIWLYR